MLVPVVVAGFWALPVSIVAAITRYRLYEIDRIISRTVSYTVVVGLLAAVFFGVVVAMQALLPTGSSSLAIVASTLVVAAGFNPLRRKVQGVVDRRFNRSRYDAADVVARVTDDLRDSVDIDEVVTSIKAVITEVFGPHTLAVWVVGKDSRQDLDESARQPVSALATN
jgi:divalent metal cation (Fe/Co/Zn/Cd) transporter